MTASLPPLAILTVLASTAGLSAGTVVLPSQYHAVTGAGAGFDILGDIFVGGNTAMRGTADVLVSLSPGQLEISSIDARLEPTTWSGSGMFVNSTTFENVNVSVEIFTDPASFSITTHRSFPLSSNAQGQLAE